MARPIKKGLDYFPTDVDIFEHYKLFDVQNQFGPLGESIYMRLLCLIYKNGYYYEFKSLDNLASMLIKSIGNRWAKKQTVMQVIPFLAECNLFSSELMQKNVLTSAGIQRRYLKAIERRQPLNDLKYFLDDEDVKDLLNAHQNRINVDNDEINVCNNSLNVCSNTPKESKEKERKAEEIRGENIDAKASNSPSSEFIKPSIQDIRDYCLERKNNVDPDVFFNFYKSKDWMVGKNKMMNWKATIDVWENRENQ